MRHPSEAPEDFLEAVERQLVAATERGAGRRHWRLRRMMRLGLPWRAPTVGIAAGVAATLAASAIAATLTLPASQPKAHAAAASQASRLRSYTTAGTVPAGFQPMSFTAISELTWWLLGHAPCGSHTCTALVRTTNGGRSFTRIPAPPANQVHVSEVRFANAMDGYAYGPSLWATHDGGRHWKEVDMGADQLAAAGSYVYALASINTQVFTLERSPVGHNHWTLLPGQGRVGVGGQGGGESGLWVQGDTVIFQIGTHVMISDDNGAHFARAAGSVPGDCQFDATVDAAVIWGLCLTGMAPDDVILSTDSGASFSSTAQVPDGPLQAFAASSASSAVAAAQGPLFLTTDGGASWTPSVAPSGDWTYLGFSDATHGVALGEFGSGGHRQDRLYYTTDGGASYHYVPIGPT